MGVFQKLSGEIEAVQFTGKNWDEMISFVGNRKLESGREVPAFRPINTVFAVFAGRTASTTAELWVAANKTTLPVEIGEWVLKDELGFYPCKDAMFRKLYAVDQ